MWARVSLLGAALAATLAACGGDDEGSSAATAGTAGSGTGGTGGAGGTPAGGAAGSASGGVAGTGAKTAADCFGDIYGPGALIVPAYDQFDATIGTHCDGTDHQEIEGVEKVVFVGDSIMAGAYYIITPEPQCCRALMQGALAERFGAGTEFKNCSENGARLDDLASQLSSCVPVEPEPKKTLVVMIMGGNDIKSLADSKTSPADAQPEIEQWIGQLRAAIDWSLDPTRFPKGSYVVFANIYEYTDASADLSSCPLAGTIGLSGEYLAAGAILSQLREQYLKVAVDTGTDMVFMGEDFCGHGFRAGDDSLQCYRGPGAENWFDVSCIHPTATGHAHIAEMFLNVIDE